MPLVRYIGQPNLLADVSAVAAAKEAIAAGLLQRGQVWDANAMRRTAIPFVNVRILGPADGFSQLYVWGKDPESFVQDMTEPDFKRLQALKSAREWVEMDGSLEDARATLRAEYLAGRWRG